MMTCLLVGMSLVAGQAVAGSTRASPAEAAPVGACLRVLPAGAADTPAGPVVAKVTSFATMKAFWVRLTA